MRFQKINTYSDIQENDLILFIGNGLHGKQLKGVDNVVKINGDLTYSYHPTQSPESIFNGSLEHLSRQYSLYRVLDSTHEQAIEFIRLSNENFKVLYQFLGVIKDLMDLSKNDLEICLENVFGNDYTLLMFAKLFNESIENLNVLYWNESEDKLSHKQKRDLKVKFSVFA